MDVSAEASCLGLDGRGGAHESRRWLLAQPGRPRRVSEIFTSRGPWAVTNRQELRQFTLFPDSGTRFAYGSSLAGVDAEFHASPGQTQFPHSIREDS
jgi:hypothetical protein